MNQPFTFNSNGVYVIIEDLPESFDFHNKYRIVSVTRTHSLATQYLGPNRRICGPYSLIGDDFPVKPFEIINEPPRNLFDINNKIKFHTEPDIKFWDEAKPNIQSIDPLSSIPKKPYQFGCSEYKHFNFGFDEDQTKMDTSD